MIISVKYIWEMKNGVIVNYGISEQIIFSELD